MEIKTNPAARRKHPEDNSEWNTILYCENCQKSFDVDEIFLEVITEEKAVCPFCFFLFK